MSDSKESNKTLIEAGVHFGYSKRSAHPSMSPYVYGLKNGVSIFDLDKTQEQLDKAKEFIAEASTKGKIVFCASKNEAKSIVERLGKETHMPYVVTRWIGGTLTNFSEISKRIVKLEKMTEERERGDFDKYTKKEQLKMDREITKLGKYYGGLTGVKELPQAVVVVDPKEEMVAVKEAMVKKIPVVAIASSDCDVTGIDYVIPANDSAPKSIELLLTQLAKSVTKSAS